MTEVEVISRSISRFEPIIGSQPMQVVADLSRALRDRLLGRVVWNVNSTAAGGGVAEMLQVLLPYVRGAGIDARWAVIEGSPEFFRVTKRLHHALHGSPGDGSPLDAAAHEIYEATMHANAVELGAIIRPRDLVLLHDPQTVGLAPHVIAAGALPIWRCHIGCDRASAEADVAWHFLEPYLEQIPSFVFSRHAYVPEFCDHGKSSIITPSIDAFSPKNQELDDATVRAILVHVGLVEGPKGSGKAVFTREDGSPGRVDRQADVIRHGRATHWEKPVIVQVSRWDPLKDPAGVMHGFAKLINGGAPHGAELVLAGPNVSAVADDPEGAQVFERVYAEWRELPHAVRQFIHLASLPMADIQENAAIVNALQRHAAIVVQKSLHEGFGLTVTEAMWKERPVVASAVGGIQDQIEHRVHGWLLQDPTDLDAFAAALHHLLECPEEAAGLGRNAKQRVEREFLGIQHLMKYAEMIVRLDTAAQ